MPVQLTIITPDSKVFEAEVDSVVIPGSAGSFGILPRHAPMLSGVSRGILKVTVDAEPKYFIVNDGVVEIGADKVVVMVDRVIVATDAQDASDKLDELRLSLSTEPRV